MTKFNMSDTLERLLCFANIVYTIYQLISVNEYGHKVCVLIEVQSVYFPSYYVQDLWKEFACICIPHQWEGTQSTTIERDL